jgi:hypothetical protein
MQICSDPPTSPRLHLRDFQYFIREIRTDPPAADLHIHAHTRPPRLRGKHLKKWCCAKEKPRMDTESETATRAELDSTEVGALLLRLFEITRELRGDHGTALHSLTALEDTTKGD